MIYDFIIFGGTGLQGRICARDLIESGYSALLVGRDPRGIKEILKYKKAGFLKADLRNYNNIVDAIRRSGAKIVVNCAELVFNVPIMKACLQTRKSIVDLGGLQKITKEQFKLDRDFAKKDILNITGCGSTPGIANVMTRHAVERLDSVETMVLGFAWDSNVKAFVVPYSMQSIFDEFTQAPVTYHSGKFLKENRIKCQGTFDFKEVGRQTVYCIVHSEVYTFPRYFKYKGLKNVHYMAGFPEHSMKAIQTLIDLGFNSQDEIDIGGGKVNPLDFTVSVLKKLRIPEDYKEVENLWVNVEGKKDGKGKRIEMNCIIKTVPGWESAGSNVDTGRTISIIAQMLFNGVIKEKGVHAPEGVVPEKEFFEELAKRDMWVYEDGKRIN